MGSFVAHLPLALEGQWSGASAVGVVLTAAGIFMGTIYYLLTTLLGWRRAYYVLMVSLMSFLIILSMVWLFGAPGTLPGFGPRGREPEWIPFVAQTEFGADFKVVTQEFPNGWDAPGKKYFGNNDKKRTGSIDSVGEIDSIKTILLPALAGYFQKQGTGSADPVDYNFRRQLPPAAVAKLSDEDRALPVAEVAFKDIGGGKLLFGARIPAVPGKHPEITVFAYRDKGTVFVPALEFFVSSIVLFILHLWLLARDEVKQRARDAATTTTPTTVGTPS